MAFEKGYRPWNKGLTKEDPRVKINSERRDKTMKEKGLYGHNKGVKSILMSKAKLGKKNPMYKEKVKRSGYVVVHKPEDPRSDKSGYMFEHTIVVEEKIGRNLQKGELVHHIDENKTNNNIENLMLFESQSKHLKFHNKVKQFGFTNPILKQIENRWKNDKSKEI